MYSSKKHLNRLTALLEAHGIRHVVCCPGSRNAALIHNFNESPALVCHPVTDERSAGFTALGVILAEHAPVAVCVTSGSALLGVIPAMAEAFYRHLPLLVISADRPAEMLGQLEGQTLPQCGAFRPYAETTAIDEHMSDEVVDRETNKVLLKLRHNGGQPAHLNVHIAEPLFDFNVEKLPEVRKIVAYKSWEEVWEEVKKAHSPALFVGQIDDARTANALAEMAVRHRLPVIADVVSNMPKNLPVADPNTVDLLIHVGGHTVSKDMRNLLRRRTNLRVIRIEPSNDEFPDTFNHLVGIFRTELPQSDSTNPSWVLHVANSSSVRRMDEFLPVLSEEIGTAPHAIYCNRGTNGIEGSLSVAVGHALATPETLNVVIIGDLSFFYDQNALWQLKNIERAHDFSNLKILLLNDGGGKIFDRLPGLDASPATPFIAATHELDAEHICLAYGVKFHKCDSIANAITVLLNSDGATLCEI